MSTLTMLSMNDIENKIREILGPKGFEVHPFKVNIEKINYMSEIPRFQELTAFNKMIKNRTFFIDGLQISD